MGWVSILDPKRIAAILDVPEDWVFIGHPCVGIRKPPTTGPLSSVPAGNGERGPRPPSSTADTAPTFGLIPLP